MEANVSSLDTKQKNSLHLSGVNMDESVKLRSGMGRSEFLKKRLSKGKVYFDSGDYNMIKCQPERKRSVKEKVTSPPAIVEAEHGNEDSREVCQQQTQQQSQQLSQQQSQQSQQLQQQSQQQQSQKQSPPQQSPREIKSRTKPQLSPLKIPPGIEAGSYEDYKQQAIPTPELLYLRRASLHIPLSCAAASSCSEGNLLTAGQINKRRATLSMRDLLDVVPVDSEFMAATCALVSDNKARRGSACHIPSKLTE